MRALSPEFRCNRTIGGFVVALKREGKKDGKYFIQHLETKIFTFEN